MKNCLIKRAWYVMHLLIAVSLGWTLSLLQGGSETMLRMGAECLKNSGVYSGHIILGKRLCRLGYGARNSTNKEKKIWI